MDYFTTSIVHLTTVRALSNKPYDLQDDPDSQCAFHRAGRLCGGCKKNYSLAIASSHCIHCPNNNNLSLLIFFAAAGILLVLFISALNLTVTQGLINGFIFYANIVWVDLSKFVFSSRAKVKYCADTVKDIHSMAQPGLWNRDLLY